MERLTLELDLATVMGLFLALRERDRDETLAPTVARLRGHLYERLSIDEMERLEESYARLRAESAR